MRPNTGEPSHTSSKTSLNTTRRSLLGQLCADSFSSSWVWREHTHQVSKLRYACGSARALRGYFRIGISLKMVVTVLTFCSFLSCIAATFLPPQRSWLAITFLPNCCFIFSCPSFFRSSWSDCFEQTCHFPSGSDGGSDFFCDEAPLGWTSTDFEEQWTILCRLTSFLLCDERSVAWSCLDLSRKTVPVENSERDSFISFFCAEARAIVCCVCWSVRGIGVSSRLWDLLQKDALFSLWDWLWFRLRGPRWPEE